MYYDDNMTFGVILHLGGSFLPLLAYNDRRSFPSFVLLVTVVCLSVTATILLRW